MGNVSFKDNESNMVFNLRAAGIFIQDRAILLAKNDGADNYYLVGGRIEFGENSIDAVEREFKEELKHDFTAERLIFVNENFFTFKKSGERCHEICLYYQMEPKTPFTEEIEAVEENYGTVRFHWVSLGKVAGINLLPKWLAREFGNMPPYGAKHIITHQ